MVGWADARRATALGVLLAGAPGCFTGHLLDAARRRERVAGVRQAWVDGDRLVVAWDAEVTTDLGTPVGRTARAGAIPLIRLQSPARADGAPLPADGVRPEPRDAAAPVGARAVPLPVEVRDPGRAAVLVVPAASGGRMAPVPLAGLQDSRTAAWAWPILPLALALDAAVVPPLLAFAPAIVILGD